MNNPGIFQDLINLFHTALAPGLAAIRPKIMGLFTFLLFLETARVASGWVLGAEHFPQSFLRFLFRTGLCLWLVLNYATILHLANDSFIQLGLLAGGNALTVAQFLDPGAYLAIGFRAGKVLWDAYWAHTGWRSFATAIPYFLAWVFFVLAYAIMAIQVFVIQVELAITTVAALVMLPFAVLRGTGWIASGAISSLINVGFRFFLLALLASLVFPVLGQLTAVNTTLETVFLMVIVPWTMVLLFWKAPAIAAGILAGHPGLTAGQVVRAGVGTAMMAGAGAGLVNAGGRTALRGLSHATNKVSGGRITLPAPAAPRQPTRQVLLQTLSHSARYLTSDTHGGGANANLP